MRPARVWMLLLWVLSHPSLASAAEDETVIVVSPAGIIIAEAAGGPGEGAGDEGGSARVEVTADVNEDVAEVEATATGGVGGADARGGDATSFVVLEGARPLAPGVPPEVIFRVASDVAATGGAGGTSVGTKARAGDGGDAAASLTFGTNIRTNLLQDTRENYVTATGGAGGEAAGNGAKGGNGGAADVRGLLPSPRQAPREMVASATGGRGGDSRGSGGRGGNGGEATGRFGVETSSALGRTALLTLTGGDGGNGFEGADGGDGAASTVADGIEGDYIYHTTQLAVGGTGGASEGGIAGRGGDAHVEVDTDTRTGSGGFGDLVFEARGGVGGEALAGGMPGTPGAASVRQGATAQIAGSLDLRATGGAGAVDAALGVSGVTGGDAVGEIALTEVPLVTNGSLLTVVASGGKGGAARGAGQRAGLGGQAHAAARADVGIESMGLHSTLSLGATARVGAGGDGFEGADGGEGRSISVRNAVSGDSARRLNQSAAAGSGGSSEGGRPGDGGRAESVLTYIQTPEAAAAGERVPGLSSSAFGGSGGAALQGGVPGLPSRGVARVDLAGFESSDVFASGVGGSGAATAGPGVSGVDGAVGEAYVQARLIGGPGSEGLGSQGAQGTAAGGFGGAANGVGQRGGAGAVGLVKVLVDGGTAPNGVKGRARVFGGRGGDGLEGADAGDGADVVVENAVTGTATNSLRLEQLAEGGDGGRVLGDILGAPGRGGDAISRLRHHASVAAHLRVVSTARAGSSSGGEALNGNAVAEAEAGGRADVVASAMAGTSSLVSPESRAVSKAVGGGEVFSSAMARSIDRSFASASALTRNDRSGSDSLARAYAEMHRLREGEGTASVAAGLIAEQVSASASAWTSASGGDDRSPSAVALADPLGALPDDLPIRLGAERFDDFSFAVVSTAPDAVYAAQARAGFTRNHSFESIELRAEVTFTAEKIVAGALGTSVIEFFDSVVFFGDGTIVRLELLGDDQTLLSQEFLDRDAAVAFLAVPLELSELVPPGTMLKELSLGFEMDLDQYGSSNSVFRTSFGLVLVPEPTTKALFLVGFFVTFALSSAPHGRRGAGDGR